MKQILEKILAVIAKRIVEKYKPRIVAITGSTGKTMHKFAIGLVLSEKYNLRASEGNYNNEIGVPLTIIGEESPGRSVFGWLYIIIKGTLMGIFSFKYPEMLVLEMGVQKPGDMEKLLRMAPPDISVITSISPAHFEFFESLDAIEEEKGLIASVLPTDGVLILNADDYRASRQAEKTQAQVISYGFSVHADIRISNVVQNYSESVSSLVDLIWKGGSLSYEIGALGRPYVLASAAACSVGLAASVPLEQIAAALKDLGMLRGRLNMLPGINGSIVLDDSYNSSPASVKEALYTLSRLSAKKKIVVLGDMLELGEIALDEHVKIAQLVAEAKVDLFVTIGENALNAHDAVEKIGVPSLRTKHFREMYSMANLLQNEVVNGSVILVKGSQDMRMEKISRELLQDPSEAENVLPRQDFPI